MILSKIQFTNSELDRINYLDGWRGLAIVFLLSGHFLPNPFINTATLGVDLFFVLSGLLMSKILFVKRVNLTTFYKRRFSRIFPAFSLFIILIYGADYFYTNTGEWQNFIYAITFLRTYWPSGFNIWDTELAIGHIWSLNIEEHSYVLLALIASIPLLKNREYMLVVTLGLAALVIHIIYFKMPDIAPKNYEIRTEVAASHLLLSCGYYLIKDKFTKWVKWWMPITSFMLGIMCYSVWAPWYAIWLCSPFLLAFTVNHLSVLPKELLSALSYKPLVLMGIWSYSIYLWQQPFYFYGVSHNTTITFVNLVLLIGGILVGLLSFYVIENPSRKWLNAKW